MRPGTSGRRGIRSLVAIADRISPEVGQQARTAAVVLDAEDFVEKPIAVIAMTDVAAIFARLDQEWLGSATIVSELIKLEGQPWAGWRHGQPLTQNSLARF